MWELFGWKDLIINVLGYGRFCCGFRGIVGEEDRKILVFILVVRVR